MPWNIFRAQKKEERVDSNIVQSQSYFRIRRVISFENSPFKLYPDTPIGVKEESSQKATATYWHLSQRVRWITTYDSVTEDLKADRKQNKLERKDTVE